MSRHEDYEREYMQWRKSGKALTYSDKPPAEITYVDGRGFDQSIRQTFEGKIFSRCAAIIGISLLILMIFETLGSAAVSWLVSLMGLENRYDIYSGEFSSGKIITSLVYIAFEVLKYAVPIIFLKAYCSLPLKIILNTKSKHTSPKFFYLMIVLLVFGASMGISQIISRFGIQVGCFSDAARYFKYTDKSLLFINGIFHIYIESFLYIAFVYGIILRILMQFGDRFAINVTFIISVMVMHNSHELIPTLMIAYFSSAYVVKCGSIFPVFFGRTLYCTLCFVAYYAKYAFPEPTGRKAHIAIIAISAIVGAVTLVCSLIINKKKWLSLTSSPSNDKGSMLYFKMYFSPPFAASIIFSLVLLTYDIMQQHY